MLQPKEGSPLTDHVFLHKDPDAFHGKELTLHDCVADHISFENGILRFHMPDGFWVTPHHERNTCGKVVRTDEAIVDFSVADMEDVTFQVFTRHRWLFFRGTTVKIWDIAQLISAVNSGKCTIEFITQYRSYYEQMWHCAIRSRKKPYYRECQLYLPQTQATFYWNNLRPDREW
jgi:hypothetical protein